MHSVVDTRFAVACDEKKLDALFVEFDRSWLPGVAVGIAIQGRPVYRKGFGLASMELPVSLSPDIRMRIGSVTKQFAALAYMLLCEEGRAGIDDAIEKYLPEVHRTAHGVTMLQLMGHTAGLRDVCDLKFRLCGYGGRPLSTGELVAAYRDIGDVNAPPGTAWLYSNGGYLILSEIVERVAGRPLENVLRERIFAPLGMHDTLLPRSEMAFIPNSASAHVLLQPTEYERAYWGVDFAGAGAMVSTVDDLLRWLAHMDKPIVGSTATWQTMLAPQVLLNGFSTGYGLGLRTGQYRGVETISHLGGWIGGNAQILKAPAFGLDIVVLVNRSDTFAPILTYKIMEQCLSGLAPARLHNGPFATGVFHSPRTGRVIQLFEKEGQQIVSVDGYDLAYVREEDGVLRPVPMWSHFKQSVTSIGDSAEPGSIRFSDFGTTDELVRANTVDEPAIDAWLGRYRANAADAEAAIYRTDEGPRLRTAGRFGSLEYVLKPLAANIWRAQPLTQMVFNAVISFDSARKHLRFSTFNTRCLDFHYTG